MPQVSYNPRSADRAYLPHAGIYGEGQEHEASVKVYSVELAKPDSLDAPFDDKKCEKDSYTVWAFQVIYAGKSLIVRSRAQANTLPDMGSKNLAWMENLGLASIGETDEGHPIYDTDKLVGQKCAIKVTKPRPDKEDPNTWYTGAVTDVFGLEE